MFAIDLMSSGVPAVQSTEETVVPEPAAKRPKLEKITSDTQCTPNNMGTDSSNGTVNKEMLDKDLYSRQIYALGESAMMHLRKSSVLISGIGSVGVEIAKNLILGGVRHVTIHDTRSAQWLDLSAQYYLRDEDLGRNRAEASFERLAELNDSVTCHRSHEPLTEDFVKRFELTVLTDAPLSTQLEVNKWTRKHNRRLVVADARGLFAFVFVDVGENFAINDVNGEPCKEVQIEYIDRETGDVSTLEKEMHGFEDGEYCTFSEVKGMTEINGIAPVKVTVKNPCTFNIGEVAKNFSAYVEGGRAKEVKVPIIISHKSLADVLKDPEILMWDFGKFDYPPQLHRLWMALYSFEAKYSHSPAPRNDGDAKLLREELPPNSEVDEKLLKKFSYQALGNLSPVASVVGGIAAQEAMKAITHHMTPLRQYVYMDLLESLPGDWSLFDNEKLTEKDCEPGNTRYDGQIVVFGRAYQEALMKQRFFVVGAGAIGCELLKNLAMMGVGCHPSGEGVVRITDMDQIAISNLNRQFLFRRPDVGGKKSDVAAKAVVKFNPDFKIEALSERVWPETENTFTDDFFSDLNGVLNALDNVEARRYMDRRCIYYRLPLLDAGTMGTKGNTQIVYPHLTESYSSSVDPPEKSIPICTLKNFPFEIQHTIQWARELFGGLFTSTAESANQFLSDQRGFMERLAQMSTGQRIQVLDTVVKALIEEKPETLEDCIKWARYLFEEHFHNTVAQLLYTFPEDQVTTEGAKFWSGTKRCPHVLNFDPKQEEHFNFVWSASILRSQQYHIEFPLDRLQFLAVLKTIAPPAFKPSSNLRIATTEQEAKENDQSGDSDDGGARLQSLNMKIAKLNPKAMKLLTAIDFEKDDDSNHHMEFITAASNLRAENYSISPADRMKTKQIAGSIIPAIATTTAAIAGLISAEIYKIINDGTGVPKIPLSCLKNGFLNLALPFFAFSEPIAAPKKKYDNYEFTLWDRLEVSGPKTLRQLISWIEEESNLEVAMLSSGVSLLYGFFMANQKRQERLDKDVKLILEEVTREKLADHRRSVVFEVMMNDKNKEDVEIPYIKYNLK